METKLKDRLHKYSLLGLVKNVQSFFSEMPEIIARNNSETDPNLAANEALQAYNAEMAEFEIRKSTGLSEAQRRGLH